MAKKTKIELLLELKNKLFNNKLMQAKRKLSKTTDKMKGKLKELKMSTVNTFKAMRSEIPLFGRAMELLGNPYTLLIAGLLSVGTLFAKGTAEAKKFNHEFLQIKQLNLDKNSQQLNKYKKDILNSAFVTGQDINRSTQAYYDIQSALGFYGKEAETVFKAVAKYSKATGAELNDSINATTKAIKAFNLNATDTEMLLASNAKTVQVGITTFKELAQVQTEYAGAAAGANQKVNAANKLFAVFTSIAKDSNAAATLTKTAFQGLTQQSTIKGLKSIGINMYDVKGNLRDLETILKQVDKRFKTMSSKQIDDLINKIGGPEGLRALFVKLKIGSKDLFNTFEAFDNSKFNLDKALNNANNDATELSKTIKNKLNILLVKLGEKILPTVVIVLTKIDKSLDYLHENGSRIWVLLKNLTIAWGAFKAATLLSKGAVFSLANVFGGSLTTGILKSMGAYKSFGNLLKFNPFTLLTTGIITFVAQLYTANKELDKLLQKAIDKSQKFKENVSNITKPTDLDTTLSGLNITKAQQRKIVNESKKRLSYLENMKTQLKAQLQGNSSNAINIRKDNAELQQLKKISNPDYEHKKRISQLEFNIREHTKELTKGFDYETIKMYIKKNKDILAKFKGKGLVPDNDGDDTSSPNTPNTGNTPTDYGVGAVTTAAAATKSIVIEKIVLNQGGINTTNTTLQHMNKEEIEAWFNEAMMRVIRNAEMS